jgi:hypothetical protein
MSIVCERKEKKSEIDLFTKVRYKQGCSEGVVPGLENLT